MKPSIRSWIHKAWRAGAKTKYRRDLPGFGQLENFTQHWLNSKGAERQDLAKDLASDPYTVRCFVRAGGFYAGLALIVGDKIPESVQIHWTSHDNRVATLGDAAQGLRLCANRVMVVPQVLMDEQIPTPPLPLREANAD